MSSSNFFRRDDAVDVGVEQQGLQEHVFRFGPVGLGEKFVDGELRTDKAGEGFRDRADFHGVESFGVHGGGHFDDGVGGKIFDVVFGIKDIHGFAEGPAVQFHITDDGDGDFSAGPEQFLDGLFTAAYFSSGVSSGGGSVKDTFLTSWP